MKDEYREIPNFPKRIMVEVSNYCNHRCVFCSNKYSKRKKTFINESVAKRVIRESAKLGSKEISFHGMGEPLTNPKLVEYVKFAKEQGFEYIYIDTNGALATKEKMRELIDAGLDSVKISISAGNRDTFKKVQGKDDFDLVIENIDSIINLRKKESYNVKIYLDFVEVAENMGQGEIIKKKYQDLVDDVWISECLTQGGNIVGEYETVSGKKITEIDSRFLCYEPFNRLVITCEGFATACCMDNDNNLVFGDLCNEEVSLMKIWEGGVKTRREHMTGHGLNTYCKNCEMKKVFELEK